VPLIRSHELIIVAGASYLSLFVFYGVAPCSTAEVFGHFGCVCCLRHQGDDDNLAL
jgi:hypothetical protein